MKSICLFLFTLLVTRALLAQTPSDSAPDKSAFKHYLGVGAGLTIGTGLSYRYWPKKFGV